MISDGDLMTRSMVKNISAWFRSSFWDKIFIKKPQTVKKKGRTPQIYYKSKMKQQLKAKE
jgi:hypothetical protein